MKVKTISMLLAYLLTVLASQAAHAQTALINSTDFYPREEMDIYLCIGQSNMAGRAAIPDSMRDDTLAGVWLMNADGIFEPVRLPLNAYSNIRKDLSMQKLGPAWTFAQCVAREEGHRVGMVVNARGGSSIQQWEKGQKLYEETVKRLKQALRQGQLKAILWHQGESNCDGPDKLTPEAYKEKLLTLMENLRKEAGAGDVPVVIGELGRWEWADRSDIRAFNRMLRTIPDVLPASACVFSKGLGAAFPGTDDPHFGTEAQLEFGKRYADAVKQLTIEN